MKRASRVDESEASVPNRESPSRPVEDMRRTAKIPRVDLDMLRTESGTRPVISQEAIARHIEQKIGEHLSTTPLPSPVMVSGEPAFELDPHSRPTIDVFTAPAFLASAEPVAEEPRAEAPAPFAASPPAPIAPAPIASAPLAPAPPAAGPLAPVHLAPVHLAASPPLARPPSTPRWLVPAIVLAILVLIAVAGAAGFLVARLHL